MIVKRDYGTREANLLLESAKEASEVVAEANAILNFVPKDGTFSCRVANMRNGPMASLVTSWPFSSRPRVLLKNHSAYP